MSYAMVDRINAGYGTCSSGHVSRDDVHRLFIRCDTRALEREEEAMTTSDSREMIEATAEQAARAAFRDLGSNTSVAEVTAYIKGWMAAEQNALSAQAPSVAVTRIQAMLEEHEGGSRRRNEQSFDLGYFDGYRDALSNLISKAGRDE